MQRLFSTFPCGPPGAGLLLLRAATALPLLQAGVTTFSLTRAAIVEQVLAVAAALLLVGLWTPIAGGLLAVLELWRAWSDPARSWTYLHFAVLSAALALLGPGGCSIDARLFGRKQIHIPDRPYRET